MSRQNVCWHYAAHTHAALAENDSDTYGGWQHFTRCQHKTYAQTHVWSVRISNKRLALHIKRVVTCYAGLLWYLADMYFVVVFNPPDINHLRIKTISMSIIDNFMEKYNATRKTKFVQGKYVGRLIAKCSESVVI